MHNRGMVPMGYNPQGYFQMQHQQQAALRPHPSASTDASLASPRPNASTPARKKAPPLAISAAQNQPERSSPGQSTFGRSISTNVPHYTSPKNTDPDGSPQAQARRALQLSGMAARVRPMLEVQDAMMFEVRVPRAHPPECSHCLVR